MQVHTCIFMDNGIQIIPAVAQGMFQSRSGHAAVCFFHQVSDTGKQKLIGTGMKPDRTDMIELFGIQILKKFTDYPFNNISGTELRKHHGVDQSIGEFPQFFQVLAVLKGRKKVQIIFFIF